MMGLLQYSLTVVLLNDLVISYRIKKFDRHVERIAHKKNS